MEAYWQCRSAIGKTETEGDVLDIPSNNTSPKAKYSEVRRSYLKEKKI
jgi:hypothetical protein